MTPVPDRHALRGRFPGIVCNSERDVDQWYLIDLLQVQGLVIKIYMGLHNLKYPFFLHPPQEESLINRNSPAFKGIDHSFMGGGAAGCDYSNFKYPVVTGILLYFFRFKFLE